MITVKAKTTGNCYCRMFVPLLGLCLIFFQVSVLSAAGNKQTLLQLIRHGGYLVQSLDRSLSHRENDLFIPGSTLKIATTLMALDILGEDFRFPTHFYIDSDQNLYIKGFGDPFLISEEILKICGQLKRSGLSRVNHLFLDDSQFDIEPPAPGAGNSANPYDAPNGAIAVNFNSVAVHKAADGSLRSGEPQTPDLPIMQKLEPFISSGDERIQIGLLAEDTTLPPHLEYAAELFTAQLIKTGIEVTGTANKKKTPKELKPLLVYRSSKTLLEVLHDCLHYSNNFVANQVLLSCTAYINDSPATWSEARTIFTDYLYKNLGLSPKEVVVMDGSGLSRDNRMSPKAAITILEKFVKYSFMLTPKAYALVKSGTLEGVYCYAGYFEAKEKSIPFVIFLNQPENNRDRVLKELQRLVLQPL